MPEQQPVSILKHIYRSMLWNGNECGKNRVLRISRQPFPVKIMIDQKQLEQRFPYFLRRGALFRTEIRRGALSSPLNQRHVCAYLAVFT